MANATRYWGDIVADVFRDKTNTTEQLAEGLKDTANATYEIGEGLKDKTDAFGHSTEEVAVSLNKVTQGISKSSNN